MLIHYILIEENNQIFTAKIRKKITFYGHYAECAEKTPTDRFALANHRLFMRAKKTLMQA